MITATVVFYGAGFVIAALVALSAVLARADKRRRDWELQ